MATTLSDEGPKILSKKRERQRNRYHLNLRRASNNNLHQLPIHKANRRFSSHVPQNQSSRELAIANWESMDPSNMRRCFSELYKTGSMIHIDSELDSSEISTTGFFSIPENMPPPSHKDSQQNFSNLKNLNCPEMENFKNYSFTEQKTSAPLFKSDESKVLDQVIGMEELVDYINRQNDRPSSPTAMIMISPLTTQFNHALYSLPASSLSVTGSCTPATSMTSMTSMSRQSSVCGGLPERDDISQFNSMVPLSITESQPGREQIWGSFQNSYPSPIDDNFLQVGPCKMSTSPQISSTQGCTSVGTMEKSPSKQSSSSSSPSNRSFRRLQEQNNLAVSRPIVPKGVYKNTKSPTKTLPLSQSKKSCAKNTPSKPNYQRPKHRRVHCRFCNSHPEGFRGEHELRRHHDREHNTIVLRYICVEPDDGLDHPQPVFPLSQCKACSQQMKKYNAYYNAAAHLRRAHFNPKSKTRSKNNLDDSKRGGKGGGDWPSMKELKYWMKELEESHESALANVTNTDAGGITVNENCKTLGDLPQYNEFPILQATSDKALNLLSLVPCDSTSSFINTNMPDINTNLDIMETNSYCVDSSFRNSLTQQYPLLNSSSFLVEPSLNYSDPFNRSFQSIIEPTQCPGAPPISNLDLITN